MTLPTNEGLNDRRQSPIPKNIEEAVKLTATFVNNLSVGLAVTGGIAPIFAFLNGTTNSTRAFWQIAIMSVICFLAAAGLHYRARRYLQQELRQ